jgi:hypothetical protein
MSDAKKAGAAEGSCYCGAVRFRLTFPTRFCASCHCVNCRRAHGAAFVTWVGVPRERFELLEGEESLVRYRTETEAVRSFCGTCGSTLFYEGPRWASEVHVARANLEGEIDRPAAGHVYVDQKAPWWEITDGQPQFGGTSGMEPKEP